MIKDIPELIVEDVAVTLEGAAGTGLTVTVTGVRVAEVHPVPDHVKTICPSPALMPEVKTGLVSVPVQEEPPPPPPPPQFPTEEPPPP